MTIPKEIVWAAINFIQSVRQYSQVTDEQVEQMFDAFDPALKRHVLVQMINPKGVVRQVSSVVQKINAIKILRSHTGWSLKEAKDFIEQAETSLGAKLPTTLDPRACEMLSQELSACGYQVT